MNRSEIVHQQFIDRVSARDLPSVAVDDAAYEAASLSACAMRDIFESQIMSRLLDIVSRRLSAKKQSFYTIGSAGHEGNAALAFALRVNDPAFLHYRSGAFAIQRSKQLIGSTPLYDMLLSFTASRDDPISGGRHKVIGSRAAWIPPQTSTIASHLPKAMGAAHALGLYKKIAHRDVGLADDSIVVCSFGDASVNHSTAQGAINTAAWASYQCSPMPILFVCEDNGIGISTHTPKNWVAANFKQRPGIKYFACNGANIIDVVSTAKAAAAYVRTHQKPAFLHLAMVRLMAHAGSDIEASYHSNAEITASEAMDPLLTSAALLIHHNALSAQAIVQRYQQLEQRIERIAAVVCQREKLASASEVMTTIFPPNRATPEKHDMLFKQGKHVPAVTPDQREQIFKKEQRHRDKPLHMAKQINLALADIMLSHNNSLIFGEDIAKKGGVYGVTQGLLEKFGHTRVINTILDEQSILGLAIGLAQCGYLPIAEIQYLAYVHNAEDQIRGEAASLSFFSRGLFTNPMVIRIAGFAYQKGFGGHFHNDNSFNVFRDIPGIIVMAPSNGSDAVQMLRIAVELASRENKVVIFIEPIALYMTMDLHHEGDQLWASHYTEPTPAAEFGFGDIHVTGAGKELCILSYANGFYLSCKAAKILAEMYQVQVRVVDMRWLHPLATHAILDAVSPCKAVLIVDECRRNGSLSEALVTLLVENQYNGGIARINAEDSFIPLGDAAQLVLPSVDSIVEHALTLVPLNDSADYSDKIQRGVSS